MRVSSSEWLQSKRAIIAAIGIAISVFVLCVPTLLAHEIINGNPVTTQGTISIRYRSLIDLDEFHQIAQKLR
ncbi:hypothetical protein KIN20_017510 [Parelaphostrongylus tenuis]|uniref:Uncharacterized protein n=1 Tax=Parelaphostrongylus tenuis TaxID=148309 RepID=A0AAD5MND0_PARTN|nr:hypothetical protein KIN20_017510 [Parelaphostrongylus tenuis]